MSTNARPPDTKPSAPATGDSSEGGTQILAIPTIQFYVKLYANSFGGNDKKAMAIFKEYEPRDRITRLRAEVYALANGRVPDKLCVQVLGLTRRGKYESYPKWARMMLGLLSRPAN